MTTRGAVRAFLVLNVLAAVATASVATASGTSAHAQAPTVALTLLAQTPWTAPDDPATRVVESELRVAVVAANLGQARIGGLELAVSLGTSFLSRFEFESTISGASISAASTASAPFVGRLDPGIARTFRVQVDMDTLGSVSTLDSRVYPLVVQLLSNGEPVASLTSAAIHIVREPEQPVRLAWWAELSAPIAFDPQGRLTDPALEASVTTEGSLRTVTDALATLADSRGSPAPIDLVVEPALLDQLERMAAGYRRVDGTEVDAGQGAAADAEQLLGELRTVAQTREVQVSTQPFSGPSIPAMLSNGLQAELARQDDAGMRTLARVLGIDPTVTVTRPPGGLLDDAALQRLAAAGADAILADADTVDRPTVGDLEFAPLATAPIATAAGPTTLVLPDPTTQRLFGRSDLLADPVRAAQIVLAHLAVIWKEAPNPAPQDDGTPTVRGLAIAPPADLPTAMWGPLLQRIANAPFLVPTHAQAFVEEVTPPDTAAVLRAPDVLAFTGGYAAEVLRLRRDATAYTSMLVESSAVPQRLRTDLLYSTSRQYLPPNEPDGRPWLDAVAHVTEPAFAGVTPTVDQVFTFTSKEGTIPLRMGDPGPAPLRVRVQLQSSSFEFPNGNTQEVTLERPDQIVTFDVVAKAAGRNAIQVLVVAPSGEVISDTRITVASTALNRIALIVTLVAGVGLVALYGRRQLRRRRVAA